MVHNSFSKTLSLTFQEMSEKWCFCWRHWNQVMYGRLNEDLVSKMKLLCWVNQRRGIILSYIFSLISKTLYISFVPCTYLKKGCSGEESGIFLNMTLIQFHNLMALVYKLWKNLERLVLDSDYNLSLAPNSKRQNIFNFILNVCQLWYKNWIVLLFAFNENYSSTA